jgi:hypothetical protein
LKQVAPLGPEAESAARRYAGLTGRATGPICTRPSEIDPLVTDVVVTTVPHVQPELMEVLYPGGSSARSVPGLIFAADPDALEARVVGLAERASSAPTSSALVELLPHTAVDEVTVGGRRVVGGEAPAAVIRDAVTSEAAVVSMLAHANGFDLNLGGGLVLCDATEARERGPAGAPCCRLTGECFRLQVGLGEAAASERILSPRELRARVVFLCVCSGLLPGADGQVWGFADAFFDGAAAAVITSWSILVPRSHDFGLVLHHLYGSRTVGEAVAALNRLDENVRLAVLGEPNMRIADPPPQAQASLNFSDPDTEIPGDGGRFLHALLYGAALESSGDAQRLAAAAAEEVRVFEHLAGLGVAGMASSAGARMRRGVTAYLAACNGAILHDWTPLAGERKRVGRCPCPTCGDLADRFEFSFRSPGLAPRELLICARCGVCRDAPFGSELVLTRRGDAFEVRGSLPGSDWSALLHLRCQAKELTHVHVWPSGHDGAPQACFTPPAPWPPGPLAVTFTLLAGTDLAVAGTAVSGQPLGG